MSQIIIGVRIISVQTNGGIMVVPSALYKTLPRIASEFLVEYLGLNDLHWSIISNGHFDLCTCIELWTWYLGVCYSETIQCNLI